MNKKKILRHSTVAVLGMALTVSMTLPAFAAGTVDGSTAAAAVSASATAVADTFNTAVGKVEIGQNSYAQVKEIKSLKQTNGSSHVTFTISIHNGSSSDLQFSNYFLYVESKSGTQYSANLLPEDKNKNNISAHSTQDFHFYMNLDTAVSLSDLQFKLTQWDFNATNLEKVLGTITVPKNYSTITPVGDKREIHLNGYSLLSQVQNVTSSKNDLNITPEITFDLKNTSPLSASLSGLNFYLQTADGSMYSLTTTDFTQNKIIKSSTDLQGILTGQIPVSAGEKNWKLVVSQNINSSSDSNVELPVASYQLPASSSSLSSALLKYNFTTDAGTYTAAFKSLQRWPWQEKDILNADITITNNSGETLPLPNLNGYFMLDSTVKVAAKMINTNHIVTLQTGQSMQLKLQGNIPYSNDFSNVDIYLQNAAAASSSQSTIFHVNVNKTEPMQFVTTDETAGTTDIGGKWSYQVSSTDTYSGLGDKIYDVQLDSKNLEKRFIAPDNLIAQFVTSDGTVFPATISQPSDKILPQEDAVLDIWSALPKTFDTSGMKLIIGEAVTNGSLSTATQTPDSYVNAKTYQLLQEQNNVQSDFNHIKLLPYDLTISNLSKPLILKGQLSLSFNYDLEKNLTADRNTDNQSYLIEVQDAGGNVLLSKTLNLENGPIEESVLQLGSHSLNLAVDLSTDTTIDASQYTINIYHQFHSDHKKLLATVTE